MKPTTYIASLLLFGAWLLSSALSAQTPSSAEVETCLRKGHLEVKRSYAEYTFRAFRQEDTACFEILRSGRRIYSQGDALQFQVGAVYPDVRKLQPVPMGRDITGEGQPDLVVAAWSGGAHCCFTFYVFEIGTRFRKIAELDAGDGDYSHFEDLHHNGVLVFVTNDWTFDYWNTSFAGSPAPNVKLEFRNGKYVLARDLMLKRAPNPRELRRSAAALHALGLTPWGAPPSDLWAEMLNLIYTGHMDAAMQFLDMAWNPAWGDKGAFRKQFMERLSESKYWPAVQELGAPSAKR